jgi:sterol 14-demethylase
VSPGWRVAVDRDLCQGHGVCESEAPEVFIVSKKGDLTVLADEPPDEQRPRVELAVRYCPTHALSIVDAPHDREDRT